MSYRIIYRDDRPFLTLFNLYKAIAICAIPDWTKGRDEALPPAETRKPRSAGLSTL